MPDPSDNSSAQSDSVPDEKQCRICLDGEDPQLGRLIRPCLCKGSISYVHVKCLQKWRNASTSQSAFYACPQCHYRYAFARTRALGIATNPLFIGILAAFFFTLIVFSASFLATFFMQGIENPDTGTGFYYSSYYTWPYDVASDLMKIAFNFLRDEDIIHTRRPASVPLRRRPKKPSGPPGLLARFFGRFVLGLPVVGVASVVHLLWTMSLLGPMHMVTRWRRFRSGNRRDGSRDIAALLLMIAIIAGAIRALWQVYRWTEKLAKRVLLRAEDAILEVNV
ncbi:zf-C3HC4-domain-containing protein [Rickenella mellea]|uniref:Zf-C3HC4-domain-containing protein n=1 Tax=Rickenella mellea TaxID=50990 RepID=A0A4Y7QLJ2_9AGAM|nr:zf-C3HC4-domain-containing protein [Rickenella mellea]